MRLFFASNLVKKISLDNKKGETFEQKAAEIIKRKSKRKEL